MYSLGKIFLCFQKPGFSRDLKNEIGLHTTFSLTIETVIDLWPEVSTHCTKGHVWQKQEVEREPVLGNISLYVLEDVGFEAQWVNKDGRQAGSQVSTGKRWAGQRERPSLAAVRSTSSGDFPL